MRVLVEIENIDVIELDVQVLVHGLQRAADSDVILELDGDGVVGEGLEEAEEQHGCGESAKGWRAAKTRFWD